MATVHIGDFFTVMYRATGNFIEHRDIDANLIEDHHYIGSAYPQAVGCNRTTGEIAVLMIDSDFVHYHIDKYDTNFVITSSVPNIHPSMGASYPFDICVESNGNFLLAMQSPGTTIDILELNPNGVLLNTWTAVDCIRNSQIKLAIDCDGKTLYYTDTYHNIYRFDISTGLQLTTFADFTHLAKAWYQYGAIACAGPGAVVVTLTNSGGFATRGPLQGIALVAADRLWCDEKDSHTAFSNDWYIRQVNASTGVLGGEVSSTVQPFSMVGYYNPCRSRFVPVSTVVGAN